MKPVIVQVVQHLRPGGIETMSLDLLQQLNDKADIYIFSLEGEEASAIRDWPRLRNVRNHLRFFNKQPGMSFKLIVEIVSALKQLQANAVHTHHIGPLFYGGAAARWLGLTLVHTEHDAWHLSAAANHRLQGFLIKALKPRLVADCDAVSKALIRHFPKAAPDVIPNGINTERFLPATPQQKKACRKVLGLPQGKALIGCAARLESVKGHKFLLKALSQTDADINLVLAGEGSLRNNLEEMAERLGIANRVFFLGHLDNTLPFYQAIDFFCLPSLNEGLPLSPLEAQSCGIPTIVTSVGGCDSVVCPKSGVLIRAGSIQALIQAISSLHGTPKDISPREFVLQAGNLKNTASAYFNLLTKPREA